MAKIAFVIDRIYSGQGGTEKQLIETIRRIDRTAFEPFLICLYATSWNETETSPCKTYVLGYKGFLRFGSLCVVRRFVKLINAEKFNILHTYFEDSLFLAYIASLFTESHPVLLSSRRDIGLGNSEPLAHVVFRRMLPVAYRRFAGILANGNRIRDYAAKVGRLPIERIRVIHNGVTIPANIEPEPSLFLNWPADLWIGVVANLSPVKRIDVFLRALAILREERKIRNFRAVVLGEGPEEQLLLRLRAQLSLEQIVHFPGSVVHVNAYLQRLHIGVLCSDREGFSNAILEYMACGLPVVATSVGGNTELVDTTNGICVSPGDPQALAEALARLAQDKNLRITLGQASKRKVEESYSWQKTMNELQAYYEELLTSQQ
jgi:glycosyltransferase involved in cell wall biosynthesis